MQVTVDHRERNPRIITALESFSDVDLRYEQLSVGDYRWPDGLVFERKTLNDLLTSLRVGRLFRQAYRLRKNTERPVIILEGTLRKLIFPPLLFLGSKADPQKRLTTRLGARHRIEAGREE